MKMIKFALLTTAALTAVTVSARASELSDLKAQIEALNARMSVAEAQSAVPAGYSLLQVGRADAIVIPSFEIDPMAAKKVHSFSVVPTADMPASTVIQWSGNVKAALTYENTDYNTGTDTTYTDVQAKYGLKVVGTTDTAVGEVGVKIAFKGATEGVAELNNNSYYNSYVKTDGYWGWWKITPELTLGGGRDGSISGNGEGFDGLCSCNYAGGPSGDGYGLGDVAQMRLSYASGPIAAAIALEDGRNSGPSTSNFGMAGEIKYSGDSFGVELNAGVQNYNNIAPENAWTVNAGAHFALGDMGKISAAAGMGSGSSTTDDYTKGSVFATLNISDAAHVEMGVNHVWNTQASSTANDVTGYGVGFYYTPVSQLTIGLEGSYHTSTNGPSVTDAALVTIFSF